MVECPQDAKEFYPIYAQKKAQNMWHEDHSIVHRKIVFLIITAGRRPIECEWVDPHTGLFAFRGEKEKRVMRVSDVPKDALFLNTRYETDGEK